MQDTQELTQRSRVALKHGPRTPSLAAAPSLHARLCHTASGSACHCGSASATRPALFKSKTKARKRTLTSAALCCAAVAQRVSLFARSGVGGPKAMEASGRPAVGVAQMEQAASACIDSLRFHGASVLQRAGDGGGLVRHRFAVHDPLTAGLVC